MGGLCCEMDVIVGLGSNLGERRATLSGAVRAVSALGRIRAVSPLYETDAVGPPGPPHLNAALRLGYRAPPSPGGGRGAESAGAAEMAGAARGLLRALLAIEQTFGRVRRERWGSRTLDLDILWIGNAVVAEPDLVIPHARLRERRFALEPLVAVAPDARDPSTAEPLSAWLDALPEAGVRRLDDSVWAQLVLAIVPSDFNPSVALDAP